MSLNTRQHRENLNVLVIGGSGSGKSRFYVKPNLMQLNTSYVVTDPKGELLRSCGRLMKKAGYEIRVFNLIDMAHSNNYNPFNYIYDKDGNVNKTSIVSSERCRAALIILPSVSGSVCTCSSPPLYIIIQKSI